MNHGQRLPLRIYWEDTDAGGVVYHASYLRFMERGRTELLREAGVHQSALMAESDITFVVTEMNIRFRIPAVMDDEVVVETHLKGVGGASILLDQKVIRGDEVLVEAEVACAAVSRATGRPTRLPAELKGKLVG